jgi:hypothetical protein
MRWCCGSEIEENGFGIRNEKHKKANQKSDKESLGTKRTCSKYTMYALKTCKKTIKFTFSEFLREKDTTIFHPNILAQAHIGHTVYSSNIHKATEHCSNLQNPTLLF